MRILTDKKKLPVVILLGGVLIGGSVLVYANLETLLPCSYFDAPGVSWEKLTKKEQDCRLMWIDDLEQKKKRLAQEVEVAAKTWPEYRNEKLGIAIRHPETIDGNKMVFFQAGNILFVRTASSTLYARRNELSGDDAAILQKAKEIDSAALASPISDQADRMGGWAIEVDEINSESDLQRIIDKWYGDGCLLGKKVPSPEKDAYDIGLDAKVPPGRGDENGSCWINWVGAFKYSSVYGRSAIWNIGQDASFADKDCGDLICSADIPMAKSFRFIEQK